MGERKMESSYHFFENLLAVTEVSTVLGTLHTLFHLTFTNPIR